MANIVISSETLKEYATKFSGILGDIESASSTLENGAKTISEAWTDESGQKFTTICETEIKPKLTEMKNNIQIVIDELNKLSRSYAEQSATDSSIVDSIEI